MKKFDLNIEEILENWESEHAVREIIANAIDEQKITNCNELEIFKDSSGSWHIRDFGRGIKYEHFTQKENEEKLNTEGLIGKFGIGLKDALATFNRKRIECRIISKYGLFAIGKSSKADFNEIETLHVYIEENENNNFIGSEFILNNISDSAIENAKNFFLKFNDSEVIESTKYGQIIENELEDSKIYINGVQVAMEPNFLFSYNITSLNKTLRKALNRERSNVGRSAYSTIIRSILLNSANATTAKRLTDDLIQFSSGTTHDELKWIDVQEHAALLLSKLKNVVFVTDDEIEVGNDLIDEAREGHLEVITIPKNLREKINEKNKEELLKKEENPDEEIDIVRTFDQFKDERSQNFEFKFIDPNFLSESEKEVYNKIQIIYDILNGKPWQVKEVLISETMQRDDFTFRPAAGLWDGNRVIIKRNQLSNMADFTGTLIHEISHAKSGASDGTRKFESQLTDYLGLLASKLLAVMKKMDYENTGELKRHYERKISEIRTQADNKQKELKAEYETELKTELAKLEVKVKNEERNKSILNKIFNR
jgi:hypothetical protein